MPKRRPNRRGSTPRVDSGVLRRSPARSCVTMERLWTPWRLNYVTEASEPSPGCIFCEAVARAEAEPLVVASGRHVFVILNKFPYNNGHLMIVPKRHVGWLSELQPAELDEVMRLTQRAEHVLASVYRPHGFNMGLNLGKPAGAGVLG